MEQQSLQCIAEGEPSPKKAKFVHSAEKVMASDFWDSWIWIEYLEKGKTINGQYYANWLQRLGVEVNKKDFT